MTSPRLANAISAHSWSTDEATLALSPNSSEIYVYRASEHGRLKRQCVLRDHSQTVSGIDWNREGSFASCSHDSSAYVWTQSGESWKPELVCTAYDIVSYLICRPRATPTFFAAIAGHVILVYTSQEKSNLMRQTLHVTSHHAQGMSSHYTYFLG